MNSVFEIRVSIAAIVLGIVLFCAPQAKADRPNLSTFENHTPTKDHRSAPPIPGGGDSYSHFDL
jgi:hypothetical protein